MIVAGTSTEGVSTVSKAAQTRRILAAYRRASAEQLADGLAWYPRAGELACELASAYGHTVESTAGVIAALSPSVRWRINARDARELCAAFADARPYARPATYTANIVKACRIVSGERAGDVLGGLKVRAFWACILGDVDSVCIDRWAARVALGDPTIDKLTGDRQYRELADSYRRAARILGESPRDVQAVTWVVVRAESGIVD